MKVKLDENGRVTIPKEYRRKLGMSPGDSIDLKVESGELRVSTINNGRGERDGDKIGPATEFVQGKSLSEVMILERRERAARYLSTEARRNGNISEALLLEHYEKLARYLAECYTDGATLSEDMIRERRNMEKYLWDRAGGQ